MGAMGTVVGRDTELAAGDHFFDTIASGLAVLVVEGEAGVGKTTIWAELVKRAAAGGALVLATRAVASEARLTLSALVDLLRPVPSDIFSALPAPQRRALEGALLQIHPPPGGLEPRLLGTAVRTLFDTASARWPVVVAIDDMQWLDAGSAATLAFALRRLHSARIGVLATRRTGLDSPLRLADNVDPHRITTIDAKPLSIASLHHIVRATRQQPLSRSTLVRVHQASGGNPLFALEIVRLLDEIGTPPAGEPLPVPDDVRDLIRQRLPRLPSATRRVLVGAAILGQATTELLSAALGSDEVDVREALRIAVDSGLLRLDRTDVSFTHPLYAAAILTDADADERRAIHGRFALAVPGREERARHRALATCGPDPTVARELLEVAGEALARGAPLAAAELAELAIERIPDDDAAALADARIELGEYLKRSGEPMRAEAVLGQVIESSTSAQRARARLALASLRYETDASAAAVALCEAAIIDAADDVELLARAHATLAAVDWDDFGRRSAHVQTASRLLASIAEPDPSVRSLVLMQQCNDDVDNGRPLDPALVRQALELEERAAPASVCDRFSASLGTWLKYSDDFSGARKWLERTHQAALDEGDDGSLPYAVGHLPELELWTGNWTRAAELAQQHFRLSVELGLEAQRRQALYNLALVHVHQGRVDETRAEVAEALTAAASDADAWTRASVLPLLGFLELSLGNAGLAVTQLREATALRDKLGQRSPRRHEPDYIDALVATGDVATATALLPHMEARARRHRRHSALANVARANAVVAAAAGDLRQAQRHLDEALAEHDHADIPFDRARTMLLVGQVRRRGRQRTAARHAFEWALTTFESLGASIWVRRARAELDRLDVRRTAGNALTSGERRVVELAASGMSNREVATALFVSPKTVEANLARAYRKLGVRSRAELGAVVARGSLAPPEPSAPEPSPGGRAADGRVAQT